MTTSAQASSTHSTVRALDNSSILYRTAFVSLGLALAIGGDAQALPTGAQVQSGNVSITQPTNKDLVINQGSNKAIINWQNFDILHGESTRFNQPGANSITLNRVRDGNPTQILGTLSANGKLVIVNPNGVFFGIGSKTDVAGMIATTSDISNKNFTAGKMIFDKAGSATASVINAGSITAANGGLVALVAPGVENRGVINAKMGTVIAASAKTFSVDMYGDNLYSFKVAEKTDANPLDENGKKMDSLVANKGAIFADGGNVMLTASAAKDIVTGAVNNTGVIEASAAHIKGGTIILDGGDGDVDVSGTLDASGKGAGQSGGNITVTGKNITLARAQIDASGANGGGNVRIGGDAHGAGSLKHAQTVSADKDTTIDVSATGKGNGGTAVIWSDKATDVASTLLAKGGANGGNGGAVEVSSKDALKYTGFTDAHAVLGKAGSLLLDPTNIVIDNATALSIMASLATGTDTTVSTAAAGPDAGDITVNSAITWVTLASLTLDATHDIIQNANITSMMPTLPGQPAGGSLIMTAGGNVTLNNAAVNTVGGLIQVSAHDIALNGFSQLNSGTNDVRLLNSGAFHSDFANSLNAYGPNGTVTLNQSDAGSIQNAIDAVGSHGTATVKLDNGNWAEQVVIDKDNFTLSGSGNSILNAPTSLTGQTGDDGVTLTPIVYVNAANNVTVRGLTINGGSTADTGIAVNDSSFTTLANNNISHVTGDGIAALDVDNLTVANNTVFDSGRDGIHLDTIADTNVYGNNIFLSGRDGIFGQHLTVSGDDSTVIGQSVVRDNNVVASGSTGIWLDDVQNVYVAGNKVQGANAAITGESRDDADVFGIGDDIYATNLSTVKAVGTGVMVPEGETVYGTLGQSVIAHNTVSTASQDGIHLENVADALITQNEASGMAGDGINLTNLYLSHVNEGQITGGQSQSFITNNSSHNLGGSGIVVDGIQNAFIDTNQAYYLTGNGISVANATTVNSMAPVTPPPRNSAKVLVVPVFGKTVISNNRTYGVGNDGIHLDTVSNASVLSNFSYQQGHDGINANNLYVTDDTLSSDFEHNVVHSVGHDGIHVETAQNALIAFNATRDLTNDGIYLKNPAQTGEDSSRGGVGEESFQLLASATPGVGLYSGGVINYNLISNVGSNGVHVDTVNGVTVSANIIDHAGHDTNSAGVFVENSSFPLIDFNVISNSPNAILVSNSNVADILANTLSNNAVGISLANNSNFALLQGNALTDNLLGVSIDNSTNAFVLSDTFDMQPDDIGVRITGNSTNTLMGSTTFNGGNIGVLIDGAGDMQFSDTGSVFTGQNSYFVLQNGAMFGKTLYAGDQTFDGIIGRNMTPEQLANAEGNHTTDVADNATLGDVFYTSFPNNGDGSGNPTNPGNGTTTGIPNGFNDEALNAFQTQRRALYRRGLFSYAGRSFRLTTDDIDPGSFDPKTLNLSLLNSNRAPTNAVGVANLFAGLAPASGGSNPSALNNLTPGAGGANAQAVASQLAQLNPAAGGGAGSCANTFLGDGYATGFSCSAQ